jgi:hypothetical protein
LIGFEDSSLLYKINTSFLKSFFIHKKLAILFVLSSTEQAVEVERAHELMRDFAKDLDGVIPW